MFDSEIERRNDYIIEKLNYIIALLEKKNVKKEPKKKEKELKIKIDDQPTFINNKPIIYF